VGCWSGTIEALREMVAGDDGWPEARGAEIARRRPSLLALCDLLDAHTVLHADKLAAVAHWGRGDRVSVRFTITVTIECASLEEAQRVADERLGFDEDYGFDYRFGPHEVTA
jgi:hypothetical protein